MSLERMKERGDTAQAVEFELRLWVDGPGRSAEQVEPAMREQVRQMNAHNVKRAPERALGYPQPLEPHAISRLGEP